MPEWTQAFIFGFGLLLFFAAMGVPIGFALFLGAFIGSTVFLDLGIALGMLGTVLYGVPRDFVLIAIPLFILMAMVLSHSGIARRIYDSLAILFGSISAGLPVATVGAGAIMGAMIGSSTASVSALSEITAPHMIERRYSKQIVGGAIAGASGLAVIIPPSLTALVYAWVMEISVIHVFAAGLIPGVLIALLYSSYLFLHYYLRRRRVEESPVVSPPSTLREYIKALFGLAGPAILVIVVLGSMFTGLASVTEAAAVGVVMAALLGVLQGRFGRKEAFNALVATVKITGFVFLIVISAAYFSKFWAVIGVTAGIAGFVLEIPLSGLVVLILCNVTLLILGCIMDTVTLLLIVVPLYAIGLSSAYGYDVIWIGIIFLINLEMALTTPPYGFNLFVAAGQLKRLGISYTDIVLGAYPYLLADATVIAILIVFPPLGLWLPNTIL